MNRDIKNVLMILMAAGGFIDATTTFIGLASVFNPSSDAPLRYAFCVGPSIVVLGMMLATVYIWEGTIRSELFAAVFKAMWVAAFAYDVWTSFTANIKIILLDSSQLLQRIDVSAVVSAATVEEVVAVAFGTLFVSGSPILLSWIIESG